MGEHCEIEDGVVIGGQAGILPHKIVRGGQIVWGTPARPLEKFKEQSAWLARLPELGAMLEKQGGKLGKVVEYTSYPEAYQDLALGRVDYVVNTVVNLQTMVAEKPGVFELGQAVSGKSFPAWAVAKGNTELLNFLNGFIAKEKESGRFAELQKKWFGDSFPNLPTKWDPEF